MNNRRKGQRGVALVVVAIFMVVILGFTTLGIDVARLAFTATEVQSVADAAARGGAMGLMASGGTPGTGIARAHQVSALNIMNGAASPDGDVRVDEGQYNFATGQFECCTSPANTPCCANGQWGDVTCVAGDSCESPGAVIAMPRTEVDNIFASVLDFVDGGRIASAALTSSHNVTPVEKLAIAAPSGPSTGCQKPDDCSEGDWNCYCEHGVAPCLPIAVPSCQLPTSCNDSSCLPDGLQVSNDGSDTAAWTVFQDTPANSNTIRDFMDRGNLDNGLCDAPGPPPDPMTAQTVDGSEIDVTNGGNGVGSGLMNSTAFGLADCLFQNNLGCAAPDSNGQITERGGTVFTIPIFDLDSIDCTQQMTGNYPIVGFATIQITSVTLKDSGSEKEREINFDIIQTSSSNGSIGGGCFGLGCRVLTTR